MYKNSNTKTVCSKKVERCIYKIYDEETKVAKKILKHFFGSPYDMIISMCILILGFGIGISLIDKQHPILAQNIAIAICIIFGQYFLISFIEEKIEMKRLKNTTTYDLLKKYADYVNIVIDCAEETGNKDLLYNSEEWIEKFDYYIYMLSRIVRRRKFNDFDVAACLVCAIITSCNRNHKNAVFAFNCARKIISKPKTYIRHVNLVDVITLEADETLDEIKEAPSSEYDDNAKMSITHIEILPNEIDENALIALSKGLNSYYDRCFGAW